jgi:rare lipoprotein A
MRARFGIFKQKGNATVQKTGDGFTASHTSLPIGSKVKITSLNGGKEVIVTINNRIPASAERVIDISQASAQALSISGGAPVQLETVNN